MTPEQFTYFQSELWQIKIAVIVTGLAIVVLCALAALRMWSHVKQFVASRLDDLFRADAQTMLEKGDTAGLKALALEKLKDRPNHADGHWFLARAHYMEKEWSEALNEFETTRRIAPTWDDEYIKPYVAQIRAQQAATSQV